MIPMTVNIILIFLRWQRYIFWLKSLSLSGEKKETMLLPYLHKGVIEAGCDEAGRGCLAGAVYAAAVILPPDFENELLNDSKQLTERQRYLLREVIEREALAWAVGVVSPEEIDRINILNASFLAMHRAIDQLDIRQSFQEISGSSAYHGCKRRWEIPIYCGGIHLG